MILTNNISSLPSCLTYEILDTFLMEHDKKGNPKESQDDWTSIFAQFKEQDEEAAKLALTEDLANRKLDTRLSLPLENYCGIYSSEMYGNVMITIDETAPAAQGGLKIAFEPTALFKGRLTHWHYDTFELTWTTQMMLPKGKATFVIDSEGKAEELRVVVENPDFDFTELKLLRKK